MSTEKGPYAVKEFLGHACVVDQENNVLWKCDFAVEHIAQGVCSCMNAAYVKGYAAGQEDRWIPARELIIGTRYVVQEAGGHAFVGTYTGGRFEFAMDGDNYVRQVAKSQRITVLPSTPVTP